MPHKHQRPACALASEAVWPLREASLARPQAAMQPWANASWVALLPQAWAATPEQLWAVCISVHWHLSHFFLFSDYIQIIASSKICASLK
jgi:hypothetical protein